MATPSEGTGWVMESAGRRKKKSRPLTPANNINIPETNIEVAKARCSSATIS